MKIVNYALAFVKRNSPVILSSAAVAGVVSTSYLAAKGAFKAKGVLSEDAADLSLKEQAAKTWRCYIPAGISGIMTIGCIVGGTKIGNKRAVAAQAAFILTERAYSEYRDKVIEDFGEKTDRKVRDAIASDKVKKTAPSQEIVIVPAGSVLCCELYTGRYFLSDMESLRKAENKLNSMLINQDSASMEEFYYLIGLQPTSFSSDIGWNSDKMLELEFSTVLTEDGRPCLAFGYNYHRSLYEGLFK